MQLQAVQKAERIAVGLNAAILAVQGDEPVVAVVAERRDERNNGDGALPCGLFSPRQHEAASRPRCASACRQRPASSSGPRARSARSALPSASPGTAQAAERARRCRLLPGAGRPVRINDRDGASWRSWYAYFPWEDWRRGKPACLTEDHRASPRGLGAARRLRGRAPRDGRPQPAPAHRLRLRRHRPGTRRKRSSATSF